METKKPERLKEFLLISFVFAGVLFITMLWTSALTDRDPQGPGFYRNTVQADHSFFMTQTANSALGTTIPTRKHKNEHATPAPGMTIPLTVLPSEEVDQEN